MARSKRTLRNRETCRGKDTHPTRSAANAAMVRLLPERVTRPYHCPHCRQWHLTTSV